MKGVESYSSESAMYVTTADGKTQSGMLKYSSAGYELRLEDGTVVPIPAATVSVVRSKDTYDAEVIESMKWPGCLTCVAGFVEARLNLSQGNSDTFNLAIGANGTRTALTNKTTLYFASLYSESDDDFGVSETTANALRGGARYEREHYRSSFRIRHQRPGT